MFSPRLRYEPVGAADREVLLALARDDHIRRYLLDGEHVEDEWPDAVFAIVDGVREAGLDFYLVYPTDADEAIGFAGYFVFEELSPEPQLLYALTEPWTGRGLATEIGRALVDAARAAGRTSILSGVDAPNVASLRVLQKLGFVETERRPGAFGDTIMVRLDL